MQQSEGSCENLSDYISPLFRTFHGCHSPREKSKVLAATYMAPTSGFSLSSNCLSDYCPLPLAFSTPGFSCLQAPALAVSSAWNTGRACSLTSFRSLLKCHLLSEVFSHALGMPGPWLPVTFLALVFPTAIATTWLMCLTYWGLMGPLSCH